MENFYREYIAKENEFYSQLPLWTPQNVTLQPDNLNDAVSWVAEGTGRVLDFGCGWGLLSILCVLRGAEKTLGIDLAEEAISHAKECAARLSACSFRHGSIEQLKLLKDTSFDGVILSNILDNMRPKDAMDAFSHCVRILKNGGKLLLKLNPHVSEAEILAWDMKIISQDLLDDGMLLWNKDDAFWMNLFTCNFREVRMEDVYHAEYDKHERLFLCVK